MTGSTVWNSPVSQKSTPGSSPDQAFATTTIATPLAAASGSHTLPAPRRAFRRASEASPAKDVAPDDTPQVDRDGQADEAQAEEPDTPAAGHPDRHERQRERH